MAPLRVTLEKRGVVSVFRGARALVVPLTRLTGLVVVDTAASDESSIGIAREARATAPNLPILLLFPEIGRRQTTIALELTATILLQPAEPDEVALFASRAVDQYQRVEVLLKAWVLQYRLTPAETETLRLALDGMRRSEIARERGVSTSTVKNQVAGMLPKLGFIDLDQAVVMFYRQLARID